MTEPFDVLTEEMRAGKQAADELERLILQGAFANFNVGQTSKKRKKPERSIGKIVVQPVIENNELNALRLVVAPHAMILNYGWERTYSNGTRMKMDPSGFVSNPLYESNALEVLATRIADLRGWKVSNLVLGIPSRVG